MELLRRVRGDCRHNWKPCLPRFEILPFETPADAYLRSAANAPRARRYTRFGANDLLIAAQAHALGYTVVTDNDKEFARSKIFGAKTGCGELECLFRRAS